MARSSLCRMRNPDVFTVSLVKRPANRRRFLFAKEADAGAPILECDAPFVKRAVAGVDGTHFVTGIVYEPNTPDTDNDYMTPEDVQKAAFSFMAKEQVIDRGHDFAPLDGVYVAESYIAKSDFSLDGKPVREGSWVLTLGISNEDIWNAIESGELNGFSMSGVASFLQKGADGNVGKRESSGWVNALKEWFGGRFKRGEGAGPARVEALAKAETEDGPPTGNGGQKGGRMTSKEFRDMFEAMYQGVKDGVRTELERRLIEARVIEDEESDDDNADIAKSATSREQVEAVVKAVFNEEVEKALFLWTNSNNPNLPDVAENLQPEEEGGVADDESGDDAA